MFKSSRNSLNTKKLTISNNFFCLEIKFFPPIFMLTKVNIEEKIQIFACFCSRLFALVLNEPLSIKIFNNNNLRQTEKMRSSFTNEVCLFQILTKFNNNKKKFLFHFRTCHFHWFFNVISHWMDEKICGGKKEKGEKVTN